MNPFGPLGIVSILTIRHPRQAETTERFILIKGLVWAPSHFVFYPLTKHISHSFVAGGPLAMIQLTRLDGEAFVLNAELIRYVERRGDTFVTLSTSERIVVRESMDEVVDKAIAYQQRKHFIPPPPSYSSLPSSSSSVLSTSVESVQS